jgi:poly-gamma-glutamate synthase PgsB/CapB
MPGVELLAAVFPVLIVLLGLTLRGMQLRAALRNVPIRIHVGGTRGKSSVCRLVAASLRAGGVRTVAKTTGTVPLLILPDGTVQPWRRLGAASIAEQRRFALLASRLRAQATVLECMAIRPELVAASEQALVRATIAVITNIRPDHLEEVPLRGIPDGFLGLVPTNGVLIASEDAVFAALRERARRRGTRIMSVNTAGLSVEAANEALSRAVCEAAGVSAPAPRARDACGDPGAFFIAELYMRGKRLRFANAFACNDVVSLDLLWRQHANERAVDVAVLNHRNDRPLRSVQFLDYLATLPRRPRVLLLGSTLWLRHAARRRGLDCRAVMATPWVSGKKLLERIVDAVEDGSVLWGVGNFHGHGAQLVEALART